MFFRIINAILEFATWYTCVLEIVFDNLKLSIILYLFSILLLEYKYIWNIELI